MNEVPGKVVINKQNLTNLFTSDDLYYMGKIRSIRTVLPWILLSFGLVGNALIILVFAFASKRTKSRPRLSSNGFCFVALAISDSLALIFMVARSLLTLNVIQNFIVACKLIKFFYHITLQISSWSLMLLTLDRLIAVVFIFKYDGWSRRNVPLKLFIGICALIVLINSHLPIFVTSQVGGEDFETALFTTKLYPNYRPRRTTPTPKFLPNYICSVDNSRFPFYNRYIYTKWDIYHAVIYGLVPFVVILASNLVIVYKLVENRKLIRTSKATDGSFKSVQVTLMLLSVAFVFLLFSGPISIYMTFIYHNLVKMRESRRTFIRVVLVYIAYFNNAINFYVYLALSSEFRRAFWRMISCKGKSSASSFIKSSMCTTSTTLDDDDGVPREPKKLTRKEPIKTYEGPKPMPRKKRVKFEMTPLMTRKESLMPNEPRPNSKFNKPDSRLNSYKDNDANSRKYSISTTDNSSQPFISDNSTYV